MRHIFAAIFVAACVLIALPAMAQTVYNPRIMQFDSVDHAVTSVYKVEFWLQAADPVTGAPISTYDLPKSKVTPSGLAAPEPQLQANLSDLTPLVGIPVGQTYVVRLIAVGMDGTSLSPRSPASNPFATAGVPSSVTNVRVR